MYFLEEYASIYCGQKGETPHIIKPEASMVKQGFPPDMSAPFPGYWEKFGLCSSMHDFYAFVLMFEADYDVIKTKCSTVHNGVIRAQPFRQREYAGTDYTLVEHIRHALRINDTTFAYGFINVTEGTSYKIYEMDSEWTLSDIRNRFKHCNFDDDKSM